MIGQALDGGVRLAYVLCTETARDEQLQARLRHAGVVVYPVRPGVLRKAVGGSRPIDWLAIATLPHSVTDDTPYGDFALVCEDIHDPGNLGTMIRTGRALGVSDLVLVGPDADMGSRRVLDASRGAALTIRTRRYQASVEAVHALRAAGLQVVATSPRGAPPPALAPLRAARVALLMGNETDGVSEAALAAADLVVQIPMSGPVESLNVGVAAGIGIYELRMRMLLTMLTDRIRATLGRELAVTGRFARVALDAELRRSGDIDADQFIALMIVACERSTPLPELTGDLGVDHGRLTELLGPLHERGYLHVDADRAVIQAPGEQAVAALWAVQERVEAQLYDGLSSEERDRLRDLLGRVCANARRATLRNG